MVGRAYNELYPENFLKKRKGHENRIKMLGKLVTNDETDEAVSSKFLPYSNTTERLGQNSAEWNTVK